MKLPAAPPVREIQLDLSGDRAVEWSWVSAHIPDGPGYALDFGPGGSNLSTIAAMKGYNVVGVDMLDVERPFLLPNLAFIKGDLNRMPLPEQHFHLIINCSTVEHSGISGRYNIAEEDENGDLKAMEKLRQLMRHDGVQLLTVPVGRDAIWRPLHRIYGNERLPLLLDGYRVLKQQAWTKDRYNRWVLTEFEEALKRPTAPQVYGLGCFVLERENGNGKALS